MKRLLLLAVLILNSQVALAQKDNDKTYRCTARDAVMIKQPMDRCGGTPRLQRVIGK
jgi:hypothetical protein